MGNIAHLHRPAAGWSRHTQHHTPHTTDHHRLITILQNGFRINYILEIMRSDLSLPSQLKNHFEHYAKNDVEEVATAAAADASSSPLLKNLPQELLREILVKHTRPTLANEQWLWLAQISSVCHVFRELLHDKKANVIPNRFDLCQASLIVPENISSEQRQKNPYGTPAALRQPLVASFQNSPWKSSALVELRVTGDACLETCGMRTSRALVKTLRALLTTPGILPNLKQLEIEACASRAIQFDLFDKQSLSMLPLSAPHITSLSLSGCFNNEEPFFFYAYFEKILHTYELETFKIGRVRLCSDLSVRFLLDTQGQNLRSLKIIDCGDLAGGQLRLTDAALTHGRQAPYQLQQFSFTRTDITTDGLAWFLRNNNNENLVELDVTGSQHLDGRIIPILHDLAPQLQLFRANNCHWLTNELLKQLVKGQLGRLCREVNSKDDDHNSPNKIPLTTIGIAKTRVTAAGLQEVLFLAKHDLQESFAIEMVDIHASNYDTLWSELQGPKEEWVDLMRLSQVKFIQISRP
jgi:hypothetical protein